MAKLAEKNTKACKSFNCKQNKSYDDNNFQQIIAPGKFLDNFIHRKMFIKFVHFEFQVILLAQVFGVFPICGVFAKNVKNVSFKWTNFRSIYAVLWIVCSIFIAYLELLNLNRAGFINAKKISK